ncbi:MAG TPA: YceI family protein [Bdellovibrionales bacterium]|nr:YceI family protein [Bdellovibrionales bacterium]
MFRFIPAALLFSFAAHAGDVSIAVRISPAGSYKAETKKVTGSVQKTADGGVKSENVTIDMTSLTTGIELRDKHTREHLMTDKYPQAKLVKAEGKDGKGKATLEIKGKTVEVAGTYKIKGGTLTAEFPMKISSVDITNVRYMGAGVKDEVTVTVNLPITAGEAVKRGTAGTATKKKAR